MFTNAKRQEERIGRSGTPRQQYLQDLVAQFQSPTATEELKEKIAANLANLANLANFAYDPYNYAFLRDLNCGGVPLVVQCSSSPVRNTSTMLLVLYIICRVCESEGKGSGVGIREEILKDGVAELIRKYVDSGGEVCVSFGNLARAILDKYVDDMRNLIHSLRIFLRLMLSS
ncbi:hypothetical protein Droror1_Dr00028060 [Drosera rotundifolia]